MLNRETTSVLTPLVLYRMEKQRLRGHGSNIVRYEDCGYVYVSQNIKEDIWNVIQYFKIQILNSAKRRIIYL